MQIKNASDLGKMILQARKNAKLTQEQLAAACSLGERFIRELEKGKPTCQLEKALMVALMVGITINAELPASMTGK